MISASEIDEICTAYGFNSPALARCLGVTREAVRRWRNGYHPAGLPEEVLRALLAAARATSAERRAELADELRLGIGAFIVRHLTKEIR